MKILLTFVLAQLSVGILYNNVLTAKADGPTYAQAIVQSFASVLRISRMNNRLANGKFEEDKIRDKCTRNGGPNAYDVARTAQQNLQSAISPMINETLQDPALNNYQSWNVEENVATICRIARPLRNLTMTALESIGSCLEEGERHTANTTINTRLSLIEFACEDNGRRLLSFLRGNGFQCLATDGLRNCSVSSYGPANTEETYSIENPVYRVGPPWYYKTFRPNLHECQQHGAYRNCTVELVKKCDSTELPGVVDSAFEVLEKATGCDNLLKKQENSAE